MLHLLAEPKSVAEHRDPSRREPLIGLCTERSLAPAIAGSSDAESCDQAGRVSSGPHVSKHPEMLAQVDAGGGQIARRAR
jgi:hypothetical protein